MCAAAADGWTIKVAATTGHAYQSCISKGATRTWRRRRRWDCRRLSGFSGGRGVPDAVGGDHRAGDRRGAAGGADWAAGEPEVRGAVRGAEPGAGGRHSGGGGRADEGAGRAEFLGDAVELAAHDTVCLLVSGEYVRPPRRRLLSNS